MKRAYALILVPVAAFSLAACGGDDSGGSTSEHSMAPSSAPTAAQAPGQHNNQDVMFAQMMIPHHQQAIEMSKLAHTRASSPQVKKLAADIEKAQDPEIKQMTGWLTGWGRPTPSPGAPIDHGGDHGGGMPGMMSDQEMQQLGKLSGKAFDKAFLEMMIKHHEGAVTMAKAEQTGGMFPEAKALAGAIITSQSAEMVTMRDLLKR